MGPQRGAVYSDADNTEKGFPGGASGKDPDCQCRRQEMGVQSLGWEDPLEKEMATHSTILAWRIPWTEKPGGNSPWGHKESDTTERFHFLFFFFYCTLVFVSLALITT